MGVSARNEKYNSSVFAELPERGKLVYFLRFIPCDATQSAVVPQYVWPSVCLPVCLSVTFRYRDHIGWNTSKIISRPNS